MKPRHLIGFLWVALYVVSCSHGTPFVKHHVYKVRGVEDSYDIPVVFNDRVQKWIGYFQRENHARFAVYLSRSGRYIPFMREILKAEGLPQDLVYLALIESGFSNDAYSRAHAVGPWQFIRSTGRIYGLKINSWVDERRDPEKATRAAARYLKKLYRDFGDWYLAMASYNAGEGRVRRGVQDARASDFWTIANPRKNYLKRETQEYIPKFLAAIVIAKNPNRFGFGHVRYEEPIAFDRVPVRGPLGLDVAAELAGSPVHEMRRLNPELMLGMTPQGTYLLKIPVGTEATFRVAYAQLPAGERVRVAYHTVRRGDSIWKIARRYGVSKGDLLAANHLTPQQARYIHPGKRLIVPKQDTVSAAPRKTQKDLLAYNTNRGTAEKKRLDGVEYMIRKDFAENGLEEAPSRQEAVASGKPVVDLEGMGQAGPPKIEEEDLGRDQGPGTGDQGLTASPQSAVRSPQSKYVVKRGDNLWRIARKHSVRISDLKEWNRLSTSRIHPGKTLVVSAP